MYVVIQSLVHIAVTVTREVTILNIPITTGHSFQLPSHFTHEFNSLCNTHTHMRAKVTHRGHTLALACAHDVCQALSSGLSGLSSRDRSEISVTAHGLRARSLACTGLSTRDRCRCLSNCRRAEGPSPGLHSPFRREPTTPTLACPPGPYRHASVRPRLICHLSNLLGS